MATGFGVDPTKDASGVITSGTTSKDIRNITSGLYTPGVISGGVVKTSASAMTYTISSGVAAFPIATGETVLGPVPAVTINTATSSATTTRTDIIYATQGMPTIDGHSNVTVGVGTSLPARSVILDRRVIGKGISNTNAATKTGSVDYSVPYGASMGLLHSYQDTRNGIINWARTVVNSKTLSLPTDRLVQLIITTSMHSRDGGKFDASKYCTAAFDVNVDGAYLSHFQTGGLDSTWQTFTFSDVYTLTAGTHLFKFEMLRALGPGYPFVHYGHGWNGTRYSLIDIGPVK